MMLKKGKVRDLYSVPGIRDAPDRICDQKFFHKTVRLNPSGDKPWVASTSYIDPTAQIIGKVRIGPRVFVGPNAVIRADEADASGTVAPIEIGADCNVQDGVIVHALAGTEVKIGRRTSMAHGSIIHGPCVMQADCFVGFRAVLFDVELAEGVFIGAGATVCHVQLPAHRLVPEGTVIRSSEEAATLNETGPAERAFMKKVISANLHLAAGYAKPVERQKTEQ